MRSTDLTLDDVCELIVDCEHKTAPIQETGYPSIRTPNVGRGRLILDGVNRVSEETYKQWTKRAIPRGGDLIFAREAPLGNVAIVPDNLKVCLGQRTVLIRPNRQVVEPNYLVYLLLGDDIQAKLHSVGAGATVPHVNMQDIRALPLPELPPLLTQRKVADILSAYDDLIENNTRRIKILEEMAQMIYREWFVHFRFPGHENVEMVETELGPIPEEWEVTTVGMAFEIVGGGTPSKAVQEYWQNGDITWYTPTDLTRSGTMFIDRSEAKITQDGLRHSSARLFPAFSVMMTSRATIGVLSMNVSPACTNQGFITCIPNDRVTAYYLFFWLAEQREKILSHASGATFKEISKGVFRTFEFLLPPNDLISSFTRLVDPMLQQALNLQRRNANLRQTRDLLLPKLVSGEVKVDQERLV